MPIEQGAVPGGQQYPGVTVIYPAMPGGTGVSLNLVPWNGVTLASSDKRGEG